MTCLWPRNNEKGKMRWDDDRGGLTGRNRGTEGNNNVLTTRRREKEGERNRKRRPLIRTKIDVGRLVSYSLT